MLKFYTFVLSFFFLTIATAQNFKFGKVSKEEVLEKAHPLDPEANAAVLFRKVNTYYTYTDNTGFTLVTDVHERIKIYNKEGFDWATRELNYHQNNNAKEEIVGLKAYTYNIVDGKLEEEKLRKNGIFEEEESKYRLSTKFTMPAVTEGSVIEYEYSLRSPFTTSIDDIPLQYTIPINKVEVSVKVPEYLGFKQHLNPRASVFFPVGQSSEPFNHISTHNQRQEGNVVRHSTQMARIEFKQNVYSIDHSNVPALKNESHVDYLQNYAAILKWELQFTKFPNSKIENFSQTWDGVAKTIYDDMGVGKELNRTGFFEKEVDELLKNTGDPLVKARRIYEHVKNKVKWNNYLGYRAESGAKSAYSSGEGNIGDINLLLTSMLRYAGLKADPVLVSTQDNGVPIFPTREGFNYVVSLVELPAGSFILDASDSNAGFGELPGRARNWQGRVLKSDGTSDWVNLMPSSQSEQHANLNFEIKTDGTLKGKSTSVHSGLFAKEYRDLYLNINSDSYVQILEKDKGNIIIENLQKEDEKLIGDDLKEVYEFELSNGFDKVGEKLLLKPLLFTAMEENPFKADERTHPVFFNYPSKHVKVVNILLPEGYTVEAMPEPSAVTFNGGACTYSFNTAQNGRFLRVESVFDLKTTVYNPQDYSVLKQFFNHIVEKETETIVLSKT